MLHQKTLAERIVILQEDIRLDRLRVSEHEAARQLKGLIAQQKAAR